MSVEGWVSNLLGTGEAQTVGQRKRKDCLMEDASARQGTLMRSTAVGYLKETIQGLVALQARLEGERNATSNILASPVPLGKVPEVVLQGDSPEVKAVCVALEQCLLHRIRTKEFGGVVPFWALLERIERAQTSATAQNVNTTMAPAAPPTWLGRGKSARGLVGEPVEEEKKGGGKGKGSRSGGRSGGLGGEEGGGELVGKVAVRNTVGAVASLRKVRTPLGRARGWVRQCLVSKCLEPCLSTMLREEQLIQTFYEPTALLRSLDDLGLLLTLCSSLETFYFSIDIDVPEMDLPPNWPILREDARPPPQLEGPGLQQGQGQGHGRGRLGQESRQATGAGQVQH
ncbi:unnamed protein product, partial [Discosporangium mesarthrocarpum]